MTPTTRPTSTQTTTGGFAATCTRRWVRTYTAALPTEVRDARRAVIDSDLWEHLADAYAHQRRPFATQMEVLGRMVIGAPSDITWRHHAGHNMKENRSMRQTRLGWIALFCVTFSLTLFFGANLLIDGNEGDTSAGGQDISWILAFPIGVVLVGTIGLIATAMWIRERRSSAITSPDNPLR